MAEEPNKKIIRQEVDLGQDQETVPEDSSDSSAQQNQTPAGSGGASTPTRPKRDVDAIGPPLGMESPTSNPSQTPQATRSPSSNLPAKTPSQDKPSARGGPGQPAVDAAGVGQPLDETGLAAGPTDEDKGSGGLEHPDSRGSSPEEETPETEAPEDEASSQPEDSEEGEPEDLEPDEEEAGDLEGEEAEAEGGEGMEAAKGANVAEVGGSMEDTAMAEEAGEMVAKRALMSPWGLAAIGIAVLIVVIGIGLFVAVAGIAGTGKGEATKDTEQDSGQVSGNVQQLATDILKLIKDGKVKQSFKSSNGDTIEQLERLADGKKMQMTCTEHGGPKEVEVNPNILKFIIEAANNGATVDISNITDKCHSGPGSNHYTGEAIDLTCATTNMTVINAAVKKYGGSNNGEVCPANGHWHYDFPKK